MISILRKANAWWWWQAEHRPYLLLLLGGLLQAAAFPPSPLAPLIWLGFLPVLAVLERRVISPPPARLRRQLWRTLRYGYVQFVVWNLLCCYWLMLTALKVAGGEALVALLGGLLANLLNPILMCLPLLVYVWLRRRLPLATALLGLGLAWLSFEHLHFGWELSWSWLTLGHAWSYYPLYLQYLDLTGVLGASALTLVVALGLFHLSARLQQGRRLPVRTWLVVAGAVLLPLAIYPWRTHTFPDCNPSQAVQVRIVQPNIDPYDKYRKSPMATVEDLARQIEKDLPAGTELVVLPETAIPGPVLEDQLLHEPLQQPLLQVAQRHHLHILTGMHPVRIYPPGTRPLPASARPLAGGGHYDSFNGASILGEASPRVYKKSKLVPFIERVPFLENLVFLRDWNIDIGGDFGSYGLPDSLHPLWMNGLAIAPLICYESEFPDFVAGLVQQGAGLLAVITNDGWWGRSSGYVQHAQLARLRAIENRKEVVRSANTGISCVIDRYGRMHQQLGWGVQGVIDTHANLRGGHTFFNQYGSWLGKCAVFGMFILVLLYFFYFPRTRYGP
ncbi:MAG: apolipoprotein N-acyltransferase [Sphingobacteriia bacterium]